jgi:hypothetical protein
LGDLCRVSESWRCNAELSKKRTVQTNSPLLLNPRKSLGQGNKHKDGKNQMAYHDGAWFVMDNDGNYYRVYNSNQEHADKYAADKKKTTNYKPKVSN